MLVSPQTYESIVIKAPSSKVWGRIKAMDFHFWGLVKQVSVASGSALEVGSTRTISFKDGTTQTIALTELSEAQHFFSYDIIASDPPVDYGGSTQTIRVYSVTASDETFVEWIGHYSGDVGQEVIQDQKFKRADALKELKAKMEGSS